MTKLDFTKMQGLGNDFVVLDGPLTLTEDQIKRLCDRRFGVGGDGVLVVTPGEPIRMQYWNADGRPGSMCGNGIRCVARYAVDRGLTAESSFPIDTEVGPRWVWVDGPAVRVDLGPIEKTGERVIDGIEFHLIDVGNPHAVTVVDDPSTVEVEVIGPKVESDPQFPDGINVEFVSIGEDSVTMRVWERGVGETLACGTGMAAVAFLATQIGGLSGSIPVNVLGGTGTVEVGEDRVLLAGPADYSFTGTAEI